VPQPQVNQISKFLLKNSEVKDRNDYLFVRTNRFNTLWIEYIDKVKIIVFSDEIRADV
jgi:hypothetical protein